MNHLGNLMANRMGALSTPLSVTRLCCRLQLEAGGVQVVPQHLRAAREARFVVNRRERMVHEAIGVWLGMSVDREDVAPIHDLDVILTKSVATFERRAKRENLAIAPDFHSVVGFIPGGLHL